MSTASSPSRVLFPTTLMLTMTVSAYQLFTFAVLASPLLADLDMSRAQLGLVGSVNTLVGATSSPATGRLTDRIGARRSVVAVIIVSAAAMVAMALATNVWWLALAAAIGGLPQGWGNPATNSLIASRIPVGRRGAVTGVKQSGVTLGVFLAGASMPAIATEWGWRTSVWVFAALFTAFGFLVQATLGADPERPDGSVPRAPRSPERRRAERAARAPIDPFIVRLAIYACLMGTAGGAIGRFFNLFAEESIGFSIESAGLITAVGGLMGMAARVVVGRWAETRISPTKLLGLLSIVGMSYCVVLIVVSSSTANLLWFAPPLSAIGIAAWNAVAMLAVIMFVSSGDSGRNSGFVMFGFLGGLSISAPLAGLAVDHWDTYRPVWAASLVLCAAAAVLMLRTPAQEPGTGSDVEVS
jgi:predicted MFS family arabinose efflux permease